VLTILRDVFVRKDFFGAGHRVIQGISTRRKIFRFPADGRTSTVRNRRRILKILRRSLSSFIARMASPTLNSWPHPYHLKPLDERKSRDRSDAAVCSLNSRSRMASVL